MSSVDKTKVGIVPLADRVVVRPLTDEESGIKSASGIIIPDTVSKEAPAQGVIESVGPGKLAEDGKSRIAMDVKVGDRVVFTKYGYDEIKVENDKYYIVNEASILAIISN